jgi:hypothetical protein
VFDREGNVREWEVTTLIEDDVFPIEDQEEDKDSDLYV